jgi:hypothetical protein
MLKSMTRVAVLAAVAGSLSVVTQASATPPPPGPAEGRRCSFSSVTEPAGEPEAQVGQINAGPLAATAAGASIQITCTIQVGALNSTHAGADADSVTSTVGTQVASIPGTEDDQPPTISYISPENVPVFLCTEAIINGTSHYWDATVAEEGPVDQLDTATGWTTNPGALCNEAISQEIFPGPAEPVVLLLDELVFCPLLDDVLDGSAVDAPPFKIGDDGQPDDADLYYDFNGDNQFTDDEWIFDCPPYRP